METKNLTEWLGGFTNKCYKENTYAYHPYGKMIVKNQREVICFYPIMDNDRIHSFVVNTFKVKRIDENTWYRECAEYNYAENCTRHRCYDKEKAYKIYCKYCKKVG